MAELSVGYSSEDKEVEAFTRPGIAVITAPPELQTAVAKAGQYAYLEVAKGGISPGLMDRSDDDDSDHGNDFYTTQNNSKGRVSPSPYTANTERARQFNTYVRSLIEERLDTLIPISHQPRDLVQQIISDTNSRFPEFASSTRKRIRTYLKSYRRSKRVKDMQAAAAIAHQYNNSSNSTPSPTVVTTNGVSGQKVNSTKEDSPLINIASISLPTELTSKQTSVSPPSALITINNEREEPIAKKPKLAPVIPSVPPPPVSTAKLVPLNSSPASAFSNNEVSTLRQLIQGYRESAGFLNRAADQLEEMLHKDHPNSI